MKSPRRILIACDKFKGSLNAADACAAIARGLAARFPEAVIERHPIADGGEGFAAALEETLGGEWTAAPSHDALGRPIEARYLLAGPLAVMEMAETSGMWRIAPGERDILRANTFGTGEMMRHAALESGAKRLIIGIGGSATNDGGAGMAAALGARFLAADGGLDPCPAGLAGKLTRIDTSGMINLPPVTVACDVTNPLLGPQGATRIYGPQKGADETNIAVLEEALAALARASGGEKEAALPGAGAAGGLGFGLLRFANAELVPGFDLLADITGLEARLTTSSA
jgi:glycerate 2-kinase